MNADFTYDKRLLHLSDELHRKTLIAFGDHKQGLIKPSHAFVIGEYARLRTIEALNYDEKTEKLSGIAANFAEDGLFYQNRKDIFIPGRVTEILQTKPYDYLPPRVVTDPAQRASLALLHFCIEQGMKYSNDYGRVILAKAAIEIEQGMDKENPFAFFGRVMQQEQDNSTTFQCLNNLTYGIEVLSYYDKGGHHQQSANELAAVVTAMVDLSEEVHAQSLDDEDVQKLVVWRHVMRRADLLSGMSPQ